MSENSCRNGHVFAGSQQICPECGGRCVAVDGKGNRELLEESRRRHYEDADYEDDVDLDEGDE